MKTKTLALALPLLLACGCVKSGTEPIGLAPADVGFGPKIEWDLAAKPLPAIPLPNDIATWPDPDSPTGMRVNASMVAPTQLEASARKHVDELDGWGVYAPITIEFDQPLDLDLIHQAMTGDDHFSDDVMYVVNLNPASPRYGQPAILDVGDGNFPVALYDTTFFLDDDRAGQGNLEFETVDEKATGIDSNNDGVLSVPNVMHPGDDPDRQIMSFYELATNTLIARPLLPLDEESTYAVVLTKRMKGVNGSPVQSPFSWINDVHQTAALSPLVDDGILANLGLTTDDVAFAWTFTTQSTTRDLVAVRQGLAGVGPFADLAMSYPPKLKDLALLKDHPDDKGSMYVLDGDIVRSLIRDHGDLFLSNNPAQLDAILLNYEFVDYFVAGSFESPQFMGDDGVFHLNPKTGQHDNKPGRVTWAMAIPRQTARHKAPFPVTIQIHGYTSSRFEVLAWAGTYCRFGSAVLVMDAYHHGGGILSDSDVAVIKALLATYGATNAANLLTDGRAVDLNGDGHPDNGGDFWTADAFHTRDAVRQTAIDTMQLYRILKSFDGVNRWDFGVGPNGTGGGLAGDFNGDGVVDVGGPFNHYALAGGSLGGIMAGVIPAVEPSVDVGISVSGAAGLPDVAVRSTQGGVNEAVQLRVIGPLYVGTVDANNTPVIAEQAPDVNKVATVPIHALAPAAAGDRIEVTNLATGKMAFAVVGTNLGFRINLASDANDKVRIVVRNGGTATSPVKATFDTFDRAAKYQQTKFAVGQHLVAVTNGYGFKRQTPDFRRFWNVAAIATEPGDPIAYAQHYFLEPLQILPEGPHATNMMIITVAGDHAVPTESGLAMARAAGLLPVTRAQADDPSLSYGRPVDWDPALGFDAWYATKMGWEQYRQAEGLDWSPSAVDLAETPNKIVAANYVAEGIARLRRFEADPRFDEDRPILFDVDRLSNDVSEFGQPWIKEPLRITRRTPVGISALRVPYLNPDGQHGFGLYEPDRTWDGPTYMHMLLGHYFESHGEELIDTPCLATASCEFIPPPLFDPSQLPVPTGTPSGQ